MNINPYLKTSRFYIGLFLFLSLSACNVFSTKYEFTEKAVEIIADQGGVVDINDGKILLEIPEGALSEDVNIEISAANLEDAPDEMQEIINSYGGEGVEIYRLEPDGLTFNEPVQISFEIDAGDISEDGFPAYDLIYQSESGKVEYVKDVHIDVDLENNKFIISGYIDHFSWISRYKQGFYLSWTGPTNDDLPVDLYRYVGEVWSHHAILRDYSDTFDLDNILYEFTTSGPLIVYENKDSKTAAKKLNFSDHTTLDLATGLQKPERLILYLECTAPGTAGFNWKITADQIRVNTGKIYPFRISMSATVHCLAPKPTKTPTNTPLPGSTATPTATQTSIPTITPTPTETLTPTIVPSDTPEPTATPVEIIGSVNVGTAACLYGPSSAFLFLYALAQGEPVVVWGQNSGWLLVKPDFYASPCWIWGGLITAVGNLSSLPYNGYLRILPRDYTYSQIVTGLSMSRSGGAVSLAWNAANYMLQADLYGYLVVANVCQNGYMVQLYFNFPTNSGSVPDDDNCSQTSYIIIYVIHKHGYGPEQRQNLP